MPQRPITKPERNKYGDFIVTKIDVKVFERDRQNPAPKKDEEEEEEEEESSEEEEEEAPAQQEPEEEVKKGKFAKK